MKLWQNAKILAGRTVWWKQILFKTMLWCPVYPNTNKPTVGNNVSKIKRLLHEQRSSSICPVFEWTKAIQQCASQLTRIIVHVLCNTKSILAKVIPREYYWQSLSFLSKLSFPFQCKFSTGPFHQFWTLPRGTSKVLKAQQQSLGF